MNRVGRPAYSAIAPTRFGSARRPPPEHANRVGNVAPGATVPTRFAASLCPPIAPITSQ
jgi:hypothetical protein